MKILKFISCLVIIFSFGANACFTPIDSAILSKPRVFFENSEIVLLGNVKKISELEDGFIDIPSSKGQTKPIPVTREKILISVSEILKGTASELIAVENIKGFGCGYQYQIGEKYIVFVKRSKDTDRLDSSIGAIKLEDNESNMKILELFSTLKK